MINDRIETLNADMLKEMAELLVADMRMEAGVVLDSVLTRLETLMPETEYVSFCDGLAI